MLIKNMKYIHLRRRINIMTISAEDILNYDTKITEDEKNKYSIEEACHHIEDRCFYVDIATASTTASSCTLKSILMQTCCLVFDIVFALFMFKFIPFTGRNIVFAVLCYGFLIANCILVYKKCFNSYKDMYLQIKLNIAKFYYRRIIGYDTLSDEQKVTTFYDIILSYAGLSVDSEVDTKQ